MADPTNTRQRVLRAFSQIMGVPSDQLGDDSSPDTVDAWDSLHHMRLVFALEQEFGIKFSDEQIMAMSSVERILAGVHERLG